MVKLNTRAERLIDELIYYTKCNKKIHTKVNKLFKTLKLASIVYGLNMDLFLDCKNVFFSTTQN